MLDRLEFVHQKNIIHRDIKPDNFVLGLDNKSHIIYILDFGLSKKFRSSRTHQHIKFSVNKKLTGTARYASINALKGCEQSRRDDLEAIGYVLMYFLRGSLPWQGLHVNKGEDRYKKILQKKKSTSAEDLCKGFPNEFCEYINYTRNLEFEADPDYKFLRGLLTTVLEKQKFQYDFHYDWLTEKPNINDEIAIERYIKNNTDISLEMPNEDKKEKDDDNKIIDGEKENNMNMDKYSGLKTEITSNDEARDLIFKLINNKNNRLGKNGASEIKKHPFFAGIDWDNARNMKPPFIPFLKNEYDTNYFTSFNEIEPFYPKFKKNEYKRKDIEYIGYTYKKDNNDKKDIFESIRKAIFEERDKDKNKNKESFNNIPNESDSSKNNNLEKKTKERSTQNLLRKTTI